MDSYFESMEKTFKALKQGSDFEALMHIEEAVAQRDTPTARSYLAYCLAKVKKQYNEALQLCNTALGEEPHNADIFLNLGRIYLLAGKRANALQIFQKGIKLGPHRQLLAELKQFDKRKPPVFSFLSRDHFVNRCSGKALSRLGLR
ncbi:MAG: tetratricopeptide repeat protein [Desulfuromonadaceae bacterium]|nr:tetratricopeptide repeat protein [Desulfuromonadaceae bacterium]